MLERNGSKQILFAMLLVFACNFMNGQSVINADFSKREGTPLIKTKFNVYQTPLSPMSRMERDMPLLKELNMHSLRFESAWGKNIDFNAPSITGSYPNFKYNRTDYTRFLQSVLAQNICPLVTVGYNPEPLKPNKDPRTKPNDMRAWNLISKDFSTWWKQRGVKQIDYEIWNEPDLNVFFTGSKTDYFDIYKNGSAGIKAGDANAKVGGPVTAFSLWYKDFLNFVKANNLPLDFISGHAYANAPQQLDSMRSALGKSDWPWVETYMTEYASYTTSPNTDIAEGGAQERYVAAADFLRDAKMFLNYTDLTKIFWAQWLDVELLSRDGKWYYQKGVDKMGLVDISGKRKALFNGFKIYGMLPVDRNKVAINGQADAMASSDAHNAALVIWNPSANAIQVGAQLNNLPFSKGTATIYKIDSKHSSYYENDGKDELEIVETLPLTVNAFNWKDSIEGKGVVFIKLNDNSSSSELDENIVAQDIHVHHWFPDRDNANYADFDSHTWIARLGMGDKKDTALSQIGVEMIDVPSLLRIETETFGDVRNIDSNTFLGYQLDFIDTANQYVKSVLFHGGMYHAKRRLVLPWGKKKKADLTQTADMKNATIDLAKLAPANFGGKVLISFILQNTGRNTGVKFKVFSNSTTILK